MNLRKERYPVSDKNSSLEIKEVSKYLFGITSTVSLTSKICSENAKNPKSVWLYGIYYVFVYIAFQKNNQTNI